MSAARRGGFTLLEVLVALGLLALAMAAVADLAGVALRNHEQARDLNAAVLLARGRMAALEERYEDSGFKDFDEEESGDFAEEGRPDVRWSLLVLRPNPQLSADQLLGMLLGASGTSDPGELAARILGPRAPAGSSGPTAGPAPALAMLGGLLQAQLTTFGEEMKKSLREMRLTVSWAAGKSTHSFQVITHLAVLNPRAPGGARGDSPDVPPGLAATAAASAAARAAGAAAGIAGVPGITPTPPARRP